MSKTARTRLPLTWKVREVVRELRRLGKSPGILLVVREKWHVLSDH